MKTFFTGENRGNRGVLRALMGILFIFSLVTSAPTKVFGQFQLNISLGQSGLSPATNRSLTITPLSEYGIAGMIPLLGDRIYTNTDVNGNASMLLFPGIYQCDVRPVWGAIGTTEFYFFVDPSNAVQSAFTNLLTTTPDTFPPNNYAYPAFASDARYVKWPVTSNDIASINGSIVPPNPISLTNTQMGVLLGGTFTGSLNGNASTATTAITASAAVTALSATNAVIATNVLNWLSAYGTNAYGISQTIGSDSSPLGGKIFRTLGGAFSTITVSNQIFVIRLDGTNYIPCAGIGGNAAPLMHPFDTLEGINGEQPAYVFGTNGNGDISPSDLSYIIPTNGCRILNLVFTNVAIGALGTTLQTNIGCDFENLTFVNAEAMDCISPGYYEACKFVNVQVPLPGSLGDCIAKAVDCWFYNCFFMENHPNQSGAAWQGTVNGRNNHFFATFIGMTNYVNTGSGPGYAVCSSNALAGGVPFTEPPGSICGNYYADNCVLFGSGPNFSDADDSVDVGYYDRGGGFIYETNFFVATNVFFSNTTIAKPADGTQGFRGPTMYLSGVYAPNLATNLSQLNVAWFTNSLTGINTNGFTNTVTWPIAAWTAYLLFTNADAGTGYAVGQSVGLVDILSGAEAQDNSVGTPYFSWLSGNVDKTGTNFVGLWKGSAPNGAIASGNGLYLWPPSAGAAGAGTQLPGHITNITNANIIVELYK